MDLSSLPTAVKTFECLGAISLLIQTAEFLRLRPATAVTGVWSWPIQRADLAHASASTQRVFDALFDDALVHAHLWLRALMAASLFFGSTPLTAAFLFASGIVILIRWRGAFNGGSDFMTLVFATALLIGNLATPFFGETLAWRAALWYGCIHAVTSYFISGAIKLFSVRWRNGTALTHFLDGGIYGPLPAQSSFRRPIVAVACSWAFIVWEFAFPIALLDPRHALLWCTVAGGFHVLVFRYFGLNRFFWAWLTMFPAIIHCAGQW